MTIKYVVFVSTDGTKAWYLNGNLHREDGPAIEYADGSTEWYLNGKLHREGGPAVEYIKGIKGWYLNGKKHREDGPAVEWPFSYEWYLEGIKYSETDYNEEIKRRKQPETVELTMSEIENLLGKKIKIINKDNN